MYSGVLHFPFNSIWKWAVPPKVGRCTWKKNERGTKRSRWEAAEVWRWPTDAVQLLLHRLFLLGAGHQKRNNRGDRVKQGQTAKIRCLVCYCFLFFYTGWDRKVARNSCLQAAYVTSIAHATACVFLYLNPTYLLFERSEFLVATSKKKQLYSVRVYG